jgi:hypothetical protein
MTIHQASRTLLKSPPELWAECSDATSLMRHLDSFGEIRITRLEPETAVAWEGDTVSGTVRLEPSGWGTRVTLTAHETVLDGRESEQAPDTEPAAGESAVPVAGSPSGVETQPGSEVTAESDAAAEPETVPELAAKTEPVGGDLLASHPTESGPVREPALAAPTARGGVLSRIKAWMRGPAPAPPDAAVIEPEAVVVVESMPGLEPVGSVIPKVENEEPDGVSCPDSEREAEPAPGADAEPESAAAAEPESVTRAAPEPKTHAEPQAIGPGGTPVDGLTEALDSLGMAHHRPYSRS